MRTVYFLICLILLFIISACAPTIFGVPQDQWNQMSAEQRQTAIEGYNERARIQAQRRLVDSRRAAERARQAGIDAELEAERERKRISAIYDGRGGINGDLLQVSVRGGRMKFDGKHREYRPLSFRIANGDRKPITFRKEGTQGHHSVTVWVEYHDGNFIFDAGATKQEGRYAKQIIYEPAWRRGKTYTSLSLGNHTVSEVENISITIQILPISGQRG